MACLTPLPLDEAREVVRAFGFDLVQLVPMEQGSVNSNFRIETQQGLFFGRIYEEQSVLGASREMQLIRELAALGVPTPVPLQPQGSSEPVLAAGKPFALYAWIEGQILCHRLLTPTHLEQVGAALARLHLATNNLSHIPQGRFEPQDVERRLGSIEQMLAESDSTLKAAVATIRRQLKHYTGVRQGGLPSGVVHGDLFRDNALWSGDKLAALIDFESASLGVFAYDIMVCIHAWCFLDQFHLDWVRAFFQGYQKVRPLSAVEAQGLPVEGALAALRFATTRISDFSLRALSGVPPKRDYRRFLQRLEQIEAGALGAVFAELV